MVGLRHSQRPLLYCPVCTCAYLGCVQAQAGQFASARMCRHGCCSGASGTDDCGIAPAHNSFNTVVRSSARRYIYTRLASLTRHIFNKADDKLLAYLNEEGQSIEPEWWVGHWKAQRDGMALGACRSTVVMLSFRICIIGKAGGVEGIFTAGLDVHWAAE